LPLSLRKKKAQAALKKLGPLVRWGWSAGHGYETENHRNPPVYHEYATGLPNQLLVVQLPQGI
jgi:hypothetical protein